MINDADDAIRRLDDLVRAQRGAGGAVAAAPAKEETP